MSTLKQYWKALGPVITLVGSIANAAGPGVWWAYIALGVIGLGTTLFGPANATK